MGIFEQLVQLERQLLDKLESILLNRWVLRGIAAGGILAIMIIAYAIVVD